MEKDEMFYIADLKQFAETGRLKWIDGTNQMWVQQYPFDSWSHPIFSDTTIDLTTATRLKKSFDDNVRGTKNIADYEHGLDKAKGGIAAGVIQELKVVEEPRGIFTQPGLWARVEFTDRAKSEIDAGEWNYWSSSHYDTWTHPQTKEQHELVYAGGGLTNNPYVKGMVPLNFSELGVSEAQAVELLEPPVVDDVNTELVLAQADAIKAGITVDAGMTADEIRNAISLKDINDEGGEMEPNELEINLRSLLGIGESDDIVAHVTGMQTELEPLRNALKEHNDRKAFSETFPEEYARLQRLETESHENNAKAFSQSYADRRFTQKEGDEDKALTYGLSGLALEKIQDFAKSFSDNTATREGFKEVLDSIMENGIVDYGTRGSSREDENDDGKKDFDEKSAASGSPREVRKIFFDKVKEIEKADEVPFETALELGAKQYPVLAAAYRESNPALKQ